MLLQKKALSYQFTCIHTYIHTYIHTFIIQLWTLGIKLTQIYVNGHDNKDFYKRKEFSFFIQTCILQINSSEFLAQRIILSRRNIRHIHGVYKTFKGHLKVTVSEIKIV